MYVSLWLSLKRFHGHGTSFFLFFAFFCTESTSLDIHVEWCYRKMYSSILKPSEMRCLVWIIICTWDGHGILCQSGRVDEWLQETSCFGVNSYKGTFSLSWVAESYLYCLNGPNNERLQESLLFGTEWPRVLGESVPTRMTSLYKTTPINQSTVFDFSSCKNVKWSNFNLEE